MFVNMSFHIKSCLTGPEKILHICKFPFDLSNQKETFCIILKSLKCVFNNWFSIQHFSLSVEYINLYRENFKLKLAQAQMLVIENISDYDDAVNL